MAGMINYDDLTPEVKAKLTSKAGLVKPKHLVLGRVLLDLQTLTHREAVWVLRSALNLVSGRTWTSHKTLLNKSYKEKEP